MSALSQKQTKRHVNAMSALPPKADIRAATRDVRFGPIADIRASEDRNSPANSASRARQSSPDFGELIRPAIGLPTYSSAVGWSLLSKRSVRDALDFPMSTMDNDKPPVERRLAAILVADVVGYSRLMGANEEATHARLKSLRSELIDPKITQHRGRIVKATGDGMLIEFPSVVEAVRCAVEVQQGMAERNVEVPSDQRMDFRVGGKLNNGKR